MNNKKNKVDYRSASDAAKKLMLTLDEAKFKSFPDVADFCTKVTEETDGELRFTDDICALDVRQIVRADFSDDASCFDAENCRIPAKGCR